MSGQRRLNGTANAVPFGLYARQGQLSAGRTRPSLDRRAGQPLPRSGVALALDEIRLPGALPGDTSVSHSIGSLDSKKGRISALGLTADPGHSAEPVKARVGLASACNVGFDAEMDRANTQEHDVSGVAVLRVARTTDIDGVLALADAGGSGLTNLPPDRAMLANRIDASERAITDAGAREAGAAIMLVVERDARIVAVSGVFPRVGAEWPFYSYRLTRQANRSPAVGRLQAQTLLNLVNDFDGEAEVGMLFVDPAMRGGALGALAARGRYLFIAAHRDWFGRRVMAELRGWQDADGNSPVWEAIGRHFYDMDFQEADRTGALTGNQFIADLGPRYPLYLSLLPAAARAALGRPHDDGRPAFDMLMTEGFQAGDYVDIFDGGPTVVADIDAVRTVRDARQVAMTQVAAGGVKSLVAVGSGADFRVARGEVDAAGRIDPALAGALGLKTGDQMLVVAA